MDKPDPTKLLAELAERNGLRYAERGNRYLGIHDGLCVDASEHRGTIGFHFFSPTARINGQILEDFAGFTHLGETTVRPAWLRGRMVNGRETDPCGCTLELDQGRLAAVSRDDFLQLPAVVAKDFQKYGAQKELAACTMCGGEHPAHLVRVNAQYQAACDDCFEELQTAGPTGEVRGPVVIHWPRAVLALVLGLVVFAGLWGLIQQPSIQPDDGRILLVVPALGAFFLCAAVGWAARGVTMPLRLLTVVVAFSAVLIGNIWGYRSAVNEAIAPQALSWREAAELYFTRQLPGDPDSEAWYLFGGVIGAYIGFDFMRATGILKYQ